MGAGKSKAEGKGDNEDNVEDIARNAPADQLIAAARDLPLCRGHPFLREFADALDREYVRREGGCCGDWLNGLSDVSPVLGSAHVLPLPLKSYERGCRKGNSLLPRACVHAYIV